MRLLSSLHPANAVRLVDPDEPCPPNWFRSAEGRPRRSPAGGKRILLCHQRHHDHANATWTSHIVESLICGLAAQVLLVVAQA